MVVVVEYVAGVVVGYDEAGGVGLMRPEWTEHPSERRKPLRQALLAYVCEIETTAALATVTCTVVVVVVVEHVV